MREGMGVRERRESVRLYVDQLCVVVVVVVVRWLGGGIAENVVGVREWGW